MSKVPVRFFFLCMIYCIIIVVLDMNIYGIQKQKLEEYFLSKGEKKFKATQVFEWLYIHGVTSFDDMSNIKKEMLEELKQDFCMSWITIEKRQDDVLTHKYLFRLEDDNFVEAVLMEHDYGLSICVSSQVGCNMGCAFCESGRLKKVRDLQSYEMVEQIMLVQKDIGKRISSVVIMGIGEPMDNYDNVMSFIKIINDAKGLAIGARHITVSTCGIVPKIEQLSLEPLQINLAISLHAPNDELRSRLMKVNKVYSISKLVETLKSYIAKTNRRVTIEYVMLKYINDRYEHAIELAKLLQGMNVYVNLIPYNETNHIEFEKSDKTSIMEFYDTLKKNKINVTIRKEFGSNIDAACGQLRSKEVDL